MSAYAKSLSGPLLVRLAKTRCRLVFTTDALTHSFFCAILDVSKHTQTRSPGCKMWLGEKVGSFI